MGVQAVKRYAIVDDDGGGWRFVAIPTGQWVHYEDAQQQHWKQDAELLACQGQLQAALVRENARNDALAVRESQIGHAERHIHQLRNELTSLTLERDSYKREAERLNTLLRSL